jgi:hypothetical protein
MKASEVVRALADVASKGKYTVDPSGAKILNDVFRAAADLINTLEAEEAVTEEGEV